MYGRVEGYQMCNLSNLFLERKQKLCKDVLSLLDVFEPGISRSRALILYEMHVPIVLQAKNSFAANEISIDELKDKLEEALKLLKECISILQYEDPKSQEGKVGAISKRAFEQLSLSFDEFKNS